MQAQCPSCGSIVHFKSERSAYVVCSACQTLIARKDVNLEAVGKVAALQSDGSLLRLGTQGVFEGKSFELIGRIQVALGPVKEPDVVWNEWYASFSDGRNGWVGEARGEYFVSFAEPAPQAPSQDVIHLGQLIPLGKETAVVTSLTQGTALSFEGELPFVMDTAYQATFADLSTPSGEAATIDYSENPPLMFRGRWCGFDDLKLRGLRVEDEEGEGPRLAGANLKALKCGSCGAPHELHAGGISQTLVCAYCDAAMDLSQDATFDKVIKFEQAQAKVPSKIPLGTKGTFAGSKTEYTCIGFMTRSCRVEGVTYRWSEYLLYEPTHGYRWLTESNGHWTILQPLHQVPMNASNKPVGYPPNSSIRLGKTDYKHFQKTVARVEYVAGEFYWRVRVGEQSEVNDYVAPPFLLSADTAPGEFNWSVGNYLTGAEVWSAFKLSGSPPAPVGVANNQPNPHSAKNQRRWLIYLGSCAALMAFLMFKSITTPAPFFDKNWGYKDYEPDRVQLEDIEVPPGEHNLQFEVSSSGLNQRWAFVQLTLINDQTGELNDTGASLYQASGVEDGESWSESHNEDYKNLSHIKGGKYILRIEPQSNLNTSDNPEGNGNFTTFPREIFRYTVRVSRDHAQWGYFWMLAILGFFPPLWTAWRSSNFETTRWAESDHAPGDSE